MGQQGKNPSQTENFAFGDDFGSPELNSYMAMMGYHGRQNNYGGIIRQNPVQDAPPGQPPAAPPAMTNTRYGAWQPSSAPPTTDQLGYGAGALTEQQLGGAYQPNLPWGLSVPVQLGQPGNVIVAEGVDAPPTGLTWDWATGHVVGGDQQLDAFQSSWDAPGWMTPRPRPTPGMPADIIHGTDAPIPVDPATYNLRTDAGMRGDQRPITNTGKVGEYPDWWAAANDPSYIQPGLGGSAVPPPTVPPPAAPPPVTGGGHSGGLAGHFGTFGGDVSGGVGYAENPWGGLNGIEDAMTAASSFNGDRRRWRPRA